MQLSNCIHPSAIAFDLGNVLVQVDHERFCRGLGELAGLSYTEVYAAVFATGVEPAYDKGQISSRDFHEGIAARCRLSLPYRRFCQLWCEIFAPMEGIEAVLAHLAARFPLFLLSNTNELHFNYIREHFPAILQPFQACILSFQVGSRKPEAAIYQALVRQTGRPPGEILYLDDKLPFVTSARTQGLLAWQFISPEDLRQELKRRGLW